MDASFKTCMFGGFDRQDVVTFIEKTAEEHRTALETLQTENDTLRRERDDAVAENDTLRLLAEEDARLRDDNTHLEQQVQDLQQQLTAVQAENDALRGPAGEYQSLKEHVADIEISAHRRTEEFRARAMERLGQCIAQQRLWCSQRRSTYLNMNTALAEQLRAAQEAVDSADFAAFDDMIAELQRLEDELKKPKGKGKLQFEADKTVRKVGDTLASGIHGKIHEVEQENSAVEGAHKTEIVAETAARHFSHHREKSVNKPYEKVSKLEHKADVADAKLQYERNQQEHPEMKKQNMNKHYQKQNIKKEYAAARNAGSQTAGTATKSTGKKLGEKASEKIKEFFEKNKKVFIWIGVGIALLVLLGAGISSCSMLTSTGSSVIASSYLSEDDAMLGAEAQYCRMEQELQRYLDTYESTHNYDEYHFDLDDIEHDPYVLISILSALHEGEFTLDEVQGTLQMLFEKQYILTEEVIVETRYRTETDTWTDVDGNTHTETYRVPYDYYICNVKLENFNLSHVPVYIMSQEQLSMYATYMSVLGNREDLFGDSPYVDKYITNPPADYDVNPEYLNDEKFATLITEAEKYLGYPYVWGGSNPDTSFDCSGFVSYVLTNSGLVNTGRLGAQGLYNVCTPVSKANAQPGDLIFFVGTYDTPGVSHVGIYVGDGVMIHCGDPIQYTSIKSSYWQQHFYAFGRPAY